MGVGGRKWYFFIVVSLYYCSTGDAKSYDMPAAWPTREKYTTINKEEELIRRSMMKTVFPAIVT